MAVLEFSYNGLTLGTDSYPITKIEGLDSPDTREDLIKRSVDHGSFVYAQFLEERRVVLSGEILGATSTELETLTDAIMVATIPRLAILPLTFQLPGKVEQRIYCVPSKRLVPKDLQYTLGYGRYTLEFIAGDPRIYAETESTRSSSGVAVNAGTFPTYPVVDIVGPSVNPSIVNTTTGESISFTTNISAGVSWTVDFAAKTVYNDTGVSKYQFIDTDSEWWDLEPGNNSITFGGGGTFEMRWRSAWI